MTLPKRKQTTCLPIANYLLFLNPDFLKMKDDFIPDGDDTELTWSPLERLEIGQNYRYESRPRANQVQLFPFV